MSTQPGAGNSGQINAPSAWDGRPTTINQDQSKQLSATPSGTLVFIYQNNGTTTSAGELTLTSGGGQPVPLPTPAGIKQPQIYIQNWHGNNLTVSNTSQVPVPTAIAAAGPGMPGWSCKTLPSDGTNVPLVVAQCAQGTAVARYMRLNLRAPSGNLTIFAIVGGPKDDTGNNAHVIALNAAQDTPEPGYDVMTTNNYYAYEFNWGSATIYVVNLSPQNSSGNVSLQPL
jgi:hypothetical protein